MKKFLTVLTVFALAFAGCDSGNSDAPGKENESKSTTLRIKNESYKAISNVVWQSIPFYGENADIIGTWKGIFSSGASNPSVDLFLSSNSWAITVKSSVGINPINDSAQGTWTRNGNTLSLKSSPAGKDATAELSNEALTLNYRSWVGTLTSDNIDKSIKSGNTVTKTVNPGTGYIFFDVDDASYSTKDLIVVEEDENEVFNFTNNTLVVDLDDTNTTLTLGSL